MILVTGANGHYGSTTINFLIEKGVNPNKIIALVRKEDAGTQLMTKGVHIRIGDYDHFDSLKEAFKGVETLLFISGSDVVNRLNQHKNVVNAAKESRVKHIVYTSFQSKNETASSPLWIVSQSHLQTENWIKESGIPYTFLKNNLYMDFVPAFVGETVLQTGVVFLPAGNGKVGAVLRTDMAEATAVILMNTDKPNTNRVYNFSHSQSFSYQEVAEVITDITGKTIQYVSPSAEEYAETLGKYGVPSDVIGLFTGFALAQAQGELDSSSSDLEHLLGRKPTSLKAFLSNVYS